MMRVKLPPRPGEASEQDVVASLKAEKAEIERKGKRLSKAARERLAEITAALARHGTP